MRERSEPERCRKGAVVEHEGNEQAWFIGRGKRAHTSILLSGSRAEVLKKRTTGKESVTLALGGDRVETEDHLFRERIVNVGLEKGGTILGGGCGRTTQGAENLAQEKVRRKVHKSSTNGNKDLTSSCVYVEEKRAKKCHASRYGWGRVRELTGRIF